MSDSDGLRNTLRDHLLAGVSLRQQLAETCLDSAMRMAGVVIDCFRSGGKLLLCGNGGSAADCQHLAAELTSRLQLERPALPALALTTDTSFLTAHANDYDYDGVFARQVEAFATEGDALLGISTSGSSKNVINAVQEAKSRGVTTLALTGPGGPLGRLADVAVMVPSEDTQLIQECHLALEHAIAMIIERSMYGTVGTEVGATALAGAKS